MNPIVIRLLNQQLVSPQFSKPVDVVSHLGAMQAQDYRMMKWAVSMRTKKPSEEAFRKAFDSGQIIRMHLMRCTWQLVTAEDYQWMLDLSVSKSLVGLRGWMKSNKVFISEEEQTQISKIIEQTVADRTDVTKEDITEALVQRAIQMDDHRISYHIRLAEYSGLIVSGDLHPSKATYALTSQKIKPVAPVTREEALALLTTKYFQSRCPASLEDFVWWSGLNIGDCREGIRLLGDKLHIETWKGRDFYLLDGCRTRGFSKGSSLLLPPFDEYLIGYKSRDVVLAQEHRHHAHNNTGIFYPVIAHDGVICGNWSPSKNKLQAEFFDESIDHTTIDLDKNFLEYREQKIKW